MELHTLRYFWTIAEEGTISQAATVLHLTQPTLSRQLQALETELDTALFVRDGRQMQLTEAGLLLKSRAEEILALSDATVNEFAKRKSALFSGHVSIGCVEADNSDTMALMLEELVGDYPEVTFNIFTGTSDIIQDQLDKGLLDLAILLEPVSKKKYNTLVLPRRERWGLLTSKGSFLATKSVINPIDIQGIPLVLSPRPEVQQLIASWANVDYTSLNVIGTFNLIFNVLPIVANQTAAALAVEGAVKNRMSDDLVFIPTEPRIETNCVLVWRQGRVITPVVQELITRFEQAFGH
ncbi:LysR family transcriptional regulator [Lacticaseibacillus saniviri]|uniref:Lysr family transcriptional regulator n=1 Tax=Lacticaseibacillus saniviri JCM 17471 = DSM 24301 TaxID=1293598 RepID=A0A0R2MYA1_9LACO|nr:LysR family transcriptional regulator [Lacticaseibacillus saniviri]KRO18422.1 lysr family transcriptional regulator [Lacticaseibacillus saniviri JCM 17471 = DSM 24301]MCG4282203.1 LysR family transcriptional regulator [Lacticaseibacillus saniviri]